MRKVVFTIDDLAWFKKSYNLSEEQMKDVFGDKEPFKATYILYGKGKTPYRYKLTDAKGNKVNINDLNGYQKGVVLNDCMAYFTGGEYHAKGKEPCGVIKIEEMMEDV